MTKDLKSAWYSTNHTDESMQNDYYNDLVHFRSAFTNDMQLYDDPVAEQEPQVPFFDEQYLSILDPLIDDVDRRAWQHDGQRMQAPHGHQVVDVVTDAALTMATSGSGIAWDPTRQMDNRLSSMPVSGTGRQPMFNTPPIAFQPEHQLSMTSFSGNMWSGEAFPGQSMTSDTSHPVMPTSMPIGQGFQPSPHTPDLTMASSFGGPSAFTSPIYPVGDFTRQLPNSEVNQQYPSPYQFPLPYQPHPMQSPMQQRVVQQQEALPFAQNVGAWTGEPTLSALNPRPGQVYHQSHEILPAPSPVRPLSTTIATDDPAIAQVLPHACPTPGCGRSWRTPADLRHHMRYHGPPSRPCRFCDKRFHFRKDVTRHEETHRKERPYRCHEHNCGKTYRRKDHLDRHHAQKHGGR